MNKILLFICCLIPAIVKCQLKGKYIGADGIPGNLEIHDLSGNPIPIGDHSNFEGSPFLQNNFTYAVIKLKNGSMLSDAHVNYSLYNEKLFFSRNDKIYPVQNSVTEFLLRNGQDKDTSTVYHFQNGFPAINKHDTSTFYQLVWAGNNLQFLKWLHKDVKEVYNYNGPIKNQYILDERFFVFLPLENRMVEIGGIISLNQLRKKFPEYSKQLVDYNTDHKISWKNYSDLIQLFSFLDSIKRKSP